MGSKNKYIDSMEAPCCCDCGEWFDQSNGCTGKDGHTLICESCYGKEELEREAEENVRDLKESLFDALYNVKVYMDELKSNGVDVKTLTEFTEAINKLKL